MAPRHKNTGSLANIQYRDTSIRSLSPVNLSLGDPKNDVGKENRRASDKTSNICNDEKMKEDQFQAPPRKIFPYRLFSSLQNIFTSKYGLELEPRRRRFYKLVSGVILTGFAVAICKRFHGRRKFVFVSLLSRWNIAGALDNDRRGSKSKSLNEMYIVQILKSLFSILINSLRRPEHSYAEQSSLGSLRSAAQDGVVQRALIGAREIIFNTNDGWKRALLPRKSPELLSDMVDLLSKGGCSEISTLSDPFWDKVGTPILTALPFVYLACVYRMLKGLQGGSSDSDGQSFFSSKLLSSHPSSHNNQMKGQKITFSDIAGLGNTLVEVREVVSYLQNPARYYALGAESPRGILLHGSPGVGKTMIAKAIAGEADCDAFCVCSGSDFCEVYVGRGAGRIRSLFQEARKTALKKYSSRCGRGRSRWWPLSSTMDKSGEDGSNVNNCYRPATAIIFIDELDAVAKSRSYAGVSNSNDERDQTLNQLLTEMDGFFHTNGGPSSKCSRVDDGMVTIIVIAATNRAELLDPAILRRFDRHIHVPFPNKNGRMEILKVHAAKTRCRFSTIHWDYLAEETPNFSGSDLKQVVNDAALLAIRQQSKQIEQGHLLQSIQRARNMKVKNTSFGQSQGYSSSMLPFVCRS